MSDVLTVSSRGQVVLPAKIRRQLSIDSGSKLAIYATEDTIILKPVAMPTKEDFLNWLDEAKEWAQQVGYKEGDVSNIIKKARAEKRK